MQANPEGALFEMASYLLKSNTTFKKNLMICNVIMKAVDRLSAVETDELGCSVGNKHKIIEVEDQFKAVQDRRGKSAKIVEVDQNKGKIIKISRKLQKLREKSKELQLKTNETNYYRNDFIPLAPKLISTLVNISLSSKMTASTHPIGIEVTH